ncbi:MAG: sulfur carrier protein ThiS [Verrucomicrobia bacterium]|jgi:sulfur carrier protein|nr:sulfur carrier protein ThiS [Verrucomicrobiota bacterium]
MPLLLINGEPKEVVATSMEVLLAELSLPAALILVEYNGKALLRSEWPSVCFSEGDRIELMQVSAGG